MTSIRSYASAGSPVAVVRDAARLVQGARRHRRLMPGEVRKGLDLGRVMCETVRHRTGLEVVGRRVLEIGAGPLPAPLALMGSRNDAVGIDLDVCPRGFGVGDY